MIDDVLQEIVVGHDGTYALRDKTYHGEEFGNFVISTNTPYGTYALEQVRFVDCSISSRRIYVFGASTLSNVSFDGMGCEIYNFYADNRLDNVTISGGARSILWLGAPIDLTTNRRVKGIRLRHPTSPDGVCLDLSGYFGQLDILHAESKNIRINPQIHVVCERERLETVDWQNDPILSKTTFRVMLDKARLSETGVFIGIGSEHRHYTPYIWKVALAFDGDGRFVGHVEPYVLMDPPN